MLIDLRRIGGFSFNFAGLPAYTPSYLPSVKIANGFFSKRTKLEKILTAVFFFAKMSNILKSFPIFTMILEGRVFMEGY